MNIPEDSNCVKLTFIGDSGVGKTCIISRYITDSFDPDCRSTDGISYTQKLVTIKKRTVKLDIWDTAGQEKYRALGKHFYQNSFIVCLVYDITRLETFQNIKNIWYEDLKTYGEKYIVLAVVGNKCDCYEEENVPEKEARQFAKEIGAIFQLTSAKNNIGIKNLFHSVVKSYLDPEFEMKMEEMKSKNNSFISYKLKTGKQRKGKKDKNIKNEKANCC